MRAKLIFSLSFFLATWLVTNRAVAQEGSQGNSDVQELNSHPELNLNEDKTLIMDADAKQQKTPQANREASAAANTTTTKKQEPQKSSSNPSGDKTQEDPLSFNFLYFIIQKFKYSDIVDD